MEIYRIRGLIGRSIHIYIYVYCIVRHQIVILFINSIIDLDAAHISHTDHLFILFYFEIKRFQPPNINWLLSYEMKKHISSCV